MALNSWKPKTLQNQKHPKSHPKYQPKNGLLENLSQLEEHSRYHHMTLKKMVCFKRQRARFCRGNRWDYYIYICIWQRNCKPNHERRICNLNAEVPQGKRNFLLKPVQCPVSLAPQLRHVRVDSKPSMAWVKCTLCKRGCPNLFLSVPAPGQGNEARTSKSDNKRYCFNTLRHAVQCKPSLLATQMCPPKHIDLAWRKKIQFCARRPIRDWFGEVSFLRKPVLDACPLSKAFDPSKDPIMCLLGDKRSVGKRCDNSKFIGKLVCMPSPSFTPLARWASRVTWGFLFSSIYLFIYLLTDLFIYLTTEIIYLCIHLCIFFFIDVHIYLFVYLYKVVYLLIYLFILFYIYIYIYVYT